MLSVAANVHYRRTYATHGTFIDEISHDIPHQKWGQPSGPKDFDQMRAIGIDTVVLICSGHQRWLTYPSGVP